jgi:hypothetical protein
MKSVYDRGQNWITNRMGKISNCANKLSTMKIGYDKIRPRILSKGIATFKKNDHDGDYDEIDNFLNARSTRFHSIDVVDDKTRAQMREQLRRKSEGGQFYRTKDLDG